MQWMDCGSPPGRDLLSRLLDQSSHAVGIAPILGIAIFGICLVEISGRAASLDAGVERYRAYLVQDVDRTFTSVRKLQASAVDGDLAGAKQAWIDARVGWERSEVFTTG